MKHYINSIFGGIAPSYHRNPEGTYLGSCSIDPDEKVNDRLSGAIMPTNIEKIADLKDVLWFEGNDVNDDIYFYTAKGEFGRIYESDYGKAIEIITDNYLRVEKGSNRVLDDYYEENKMAQLVHIPEGVDATSFSVCLSAGLNNRIAVIQLYDVENRRPANQLLRKEIDLVDISRRWVDIELEEPLESGKDYAIVVFDKAWEDYFIYSDVYWHLSDNSGTVVIGNGYPSLRWTDEIKGTFAFKIYTKETSSGNGLRYYNNYYYIASDKEIHRYGPINDIPVMEYAWWGEQGAGLLGNLEPDVVGDLAIPNHQMFSHQDGALYVCDHDRVGGIHKIKTQDLIEFDKLSEQFIIGETIKGELSGAMGVVVAIDSEIEPEVYTGRPHTNHLTEPAYYDNWINVENAYIEDGNIAKGDADGQDKSCQTIYRDFEMGVPLYREISGIEVRIKAMENLNIGDTDTMPLRFKVSNTAQPISGASQSIDIIGSDLKWYSVGGIDDKLIPESTLELTPEVVNNTNFGLVQFEQGTRRTVGTTRHYIGVDAIQIKVYTFGKSKVTISPIRGKFIEGEKVTGTTQGYGVASRVAQGAGVALVDRTTLHLGDSYRPIVIGEYGTDIAIIATKRNQNAKLLLWDAVSNNEYKQVLLPYKRATALINHLGSLLLWGGDNGYTLHYYRGGDALEQLAHIDNGTPPLQSSVKSIEDRVMWGSKRTYPRESGCVLAYGSKTGYGGLHNILNTNEQVAAIGKYIADSEGIYDRGGRYKAVWRSELLSFGDAFEINKISIPLGKDLTEDDKLTVRVYYDNEDRHYSTEVTQGTYRNRVIVISPRREGVSNCFIEIEWDCATQIPVTFPIIIDYEVNV